MTALFEGGVCTAKGFQASGVAAGIKRTGEPDLALVVSESPAAAAGVFTTNLLAAAPVVVSRERVASGRARGVVANSGCANACTGDRGLEDARSMAAAAARAVRAGEEEMLVCSTGLIGSRLPIGRIGRALPRAAAILGSDGDEDAARAILTTDTRPKRFALRHEDGWSMGGIAKGAGMIAPNLATMLCFITTDADVSPGHLKECLEETAAVTFNRITVDGDTSTNDTVLAFANGAAGVKPEPAEFAGSLRRLCDALARAIVADGEGARKVIRVVVEGAASASDAAAAARTVGESLLVKTALSGHDPNWGRVAAALGRSGARVDPARLSIGIAGATLFAAGEPMPRATGDAEGARAADEVEIRVDLGLGDEGFELLTCDLTEKYVMLNAEDESS